MTTRAYVRESTVAQGDKFGPDAQRAAITRACADLGIAEPEQWYVDLVSGTGRTVRDSLARARADAAGGEYDVLICYDTSRWARNERDAFDFEYEMQRASVRVYYAAERIWADDQSKALHKGMLHVINADYSRQLARRIRDGYAQKRARGGHVGGVPWGYRRSEDTMTLVPIPEQVAVRLAAWRLYAKGDQTYQTVADELMRQGHRIAWRGRERVITRFTVSEFLSKDLDLRFGGLDRETYERVVDLRERHKVNERVGKRVHRYVFAGLVSCGECGERYMSRASYNRGAVTLQQYHTPRGCRRGARSEEALETQIGRWLETWRLPADAPKQVARYLEAQRERPERTTERRALEAEQERLRNLYRWGDIREADYLRERARVAAAIATLGPEQVARPVPVDALHLVEHVGEAWMRASAEARREFVTTLFAEVRAHRDGSITVVPRPAVRELVWAAQVGPVGDVGVSHAGPTHGRSQAVYVDGLARWRGFWATEATA